MKFRRFNDQGIKAFAEYLGALRGNPAAAVPADLLGNPRLTEPLAVQIEAEVPKSFPSRMAFAKWLHAAATANNADIPRNDPGFWAWMSLALFDHVCPADGKGKRVVKEDARYLPMLDSAFRYYRHSLVGPFYVYWMYRESPEMVAPVLCGSLAKLNDEAYRLFVENQLVVMPSAMGVLTELYFDHNSGKLKRQSRSKNRGSIRRLVKFLSRFARTLDLDVIPVDRLIASLPPEFDRWRQPTLFGGVSPGKR